MTDEEYVSHIWHYKVDDNMSWEFCAGILKQNGYKVTSTKLKKAFNSYFNKSVGIEPYSKCPLCSEQILPRESKYGYFIGCCNYPKCNFIATNKKKYKNSEVTKNG